MSASKRAPDLVGHFHFTHERHVLDTAASSEVYLRSAPSTFFSLHRFLVVTTYPPNQSPEPTGDVRGGLFVKVSGSRSRWVAGGSALSVRRHHTLMNCAKCQQQMEAGYTTISSSGIGSILFGLSREHLWFRTDGKPVEMVLMSRVERPCFRCVQCGLLIIEGGADRASASKGRVI